MRAGELQRADTNFAERRRFPFEEMESENEGGERGDDEEKVDGEYDMEQRTGDEDECSVVAPQKV